MSRLCCRDTPVVSAGLPVSSAFFADFRYTSVHVTVCTGRIPPGRLVPQPFPHVPLVPFVPLIADWPLSHAKWMRCWVVIMGGGKGLVVARTVAARPVDWALVDGVAIGWH
ncbi:hypothetical protein HaLaN_10291 [Haematococcus lacustris]|uniref:Uncharacterized protein n=1 Tax=Haematococcus lacustris TaxID=44745 RepID=A0A699Z4I0_HAELA|nr:hypothetical protein HaLaN_10291 [Haematococcus lacustris]